MKKCHEIQKLLMDDFYNEKLDTDISSHIENCSECLKFRNELLEASRKLDILENEHISIPGDMFNIIGLADTIKERKRNRFEIFFFIFAALGILIPSSLLGIYFGMRIVLYSQIALYLNLPLIIIPLIINKKMKEGEI